ncbi:hypothetical protein MRX96_045614 [Rhipicephalus microplus]
MPLCTIKTNLLASRIPNGFNVKFAQYVASLLKKDIEKVTVIVEPGVDMSRAGTTDPNCLCSIHSISVFSPEKNPGLRQPTEAVHLGKLGSAAEEDCYNLIRPESHRSRCRLRGLSSL